MRCDHCSFHVCLPLHCTAVPVHLLLHQCQLLLLYALHESCLNRFCSNFPHCQQESNRCICLHSQCSFLCILLSVCNLCCVSTPPLCSFSVLSCKLVRLPRSRTSSPRMPPLLLPPASTLPAQRTFALRLTLALMARPRLLLARALLVAALFSSPTSLSLLASGTGKLLILASCLYLPHPCVMYRGGCIPHASTNIYTHVYRHMYPAFVPLCRHFLVCIRRLFPFTSVQHGDLCISSLLQLQQGRWCLQPDRRQGRRLHEEGKFTS